MVLAMLFDAQGGQRKGKVRPVQMVILAVISGGLAVCAGLLSRAVFRWGNRGRRRLVTHLLLDPCPSLRLDPSPSRNPNLRPRSSPDRSPDPNSNSIP